MQGLSITHRIRNILPKSILDTLVLIKYSRQRIPAHKLYRPYVKGRRGIEIGGPSAQFRTFFPLYPWVSSLDGVNVSGHTIWEGQISAGRTYRYFCNRRGNQYISDTVDLEVIPTAAYDFLLSCNCLEHIANPFKALLEWKRVIRFGGSVILVLPNPKGNFDHRRPVTQFEHLIEDFQNNTGEDDLTHLPEILTYHDLSMDPQAGTLDAFKARSADNYRNRALHHHVFSLALIVRMLSHVGLEVKEAVETERDLYALAVRST